MIMERSKNQDSLLAKGGYHQLPRCKLNNLKIKVFLNGSRIVKGEHPVIKEEPIQDSAPKLDDQRKDLPLPEAKETPKPLFLPKRLRISVADAEATDSSSDDENGCPREPPKKKFVKEICVCSPCSSGNDSALLCSKGEKKKYRGVRQRPWGSWVAEIRESKSRRRLWLGTYPTAEEAAMAYDRASIQLHGPNAQTNFLQVDPPKLGPD